MKISIELLYRFFRDNPDIADRVLSTGALKVHGIGGPGDYRPVRAVRAIEPENVHAVVQFSNGQTVHCSPGHLFVQVQTEDGSTRVSKAASSLCRGDLVLSYEDPNNPESAVHTKVNSVKFVNNDRHLPLYDLQVDGSAYITNGVLSHNSTIMSAITYALYGKTGSKRNVSDLPNRINKSLETEIQIQSDAKQGETITIHRGHMPSIFDVYVGQNYKIDVAGKKNVQEILEKEYYGIPYYIFNNVISLSVNDFKSFLVMSPADKRVIVDKILGLEIINKMLEMNRADVKQKKDRQLIIGSEQRSVESSLETTKESKRSAEQVQSAAAADRQQEIEIALGEARVHFDELTARYEELKDKKSKLDTKNSEIQKVVAQLEAEQRMVQQKKNLFMNDHCPTCHAPLNSEFHIHLHEQLENEYGINEAKLIDIRDKHTKIGAALTKITETMSTEYGKLYQLRTEISVNEQTKKNLQNVYSVDISAIENVLQSLNSKINELSTELDEINILIAIHNVIQNVLGETGVRQQIIRSTIPILNRTVARYMSEMSMNFHVRFDENFNAILFDDNNQQVTIDTLSTGEMKKIDFAVLLSVIAVFKTKYPNLNIIFLDEIFSSVDEEGRNNIIRILKEFSHDYSMHIFIINHTEMPIEMFSSVIEVKKVHGFSELQQNYNVAVRFEHNS